MKFDNNAARFLNFVLDINTRVRSVDENSYSEEIVAQTKGCTSLRNDHTQVRLGTIRYD